MSTVTGTVEGAAHEPITCDMHWFVAASNVFLGTARVVAGAFTFDAADDTYAAYLESFVPPDYAAGWIGGGSNAQEASPIVVAGDRSLAIEHDGSTFVIAAPAPRGSRLLRSRETITAALKAGGLNPSSTGKFSAPCVLVEPGEPWAGVDLSLGRKRTGHWRLTLVAGKADSAGALERLMGLVDAADAALLTVPGISLPTWARPFDAMLDGATYAATQSTIEALTEEE
jgi:hypothetical protein